MTNANLTTRNTTIKKDKEIFDQQRLSIKSSANQSTGGLHLGVKDELDDLSDDYEDEYSYSLSGQSTPVPPTPEPTKTPTPTTPTITAEMFLKSPSPDREKVTIVGHIAKLFQLQFVLFRKATKISPV